MNSDARRKLALILIALLFASPIVVAYLLNAFGWRPTGQRNFGELVDPPRELRGVALKTADDAPFVWNDPEWHWTLLAVPGPNCASTCLAKLDELRRARLTLNQNAYRVRIAVVDDTLAPAQIVDLKAVLVRDPTRALADLRPSAPDSVAAAIVDPNGFLMLRYPAGFDANGLRKDLVRVAH